MLLQDEVSPVDGALHQQNLTLLNFLASAPDQATLALFLASIAETGDTLQLLVSSSSVTKSFIVMNTLKKQLTVVCGGMDNAFSQAPLVLQSWADTSTPGTGPFCYQAAATFIASMVSLVPGGGYQNVRIIGHSYGGAVAMWLPAALNPIWSNAGVKQCYTYGCPKPSPVASTFVLPGLDVRRTFIYNDPIPQLPPDSSAIGPLWPLVGVPLARNWAKWLQGVSGLSFDGQGGMVQQNAPSVFTSPSVFYLSLLRWLTSSDVFGSDKHSLSAYTQACALVRNAPRATSAPVTQRVRRRPDPTTAELTLTRDENVAVIATNTSADPRDAAIGIQSGIVQVPGLRYRGIKVDGIPWVYYGDTPVIPTRNLRTRRALVRYLNRAL